ncbi:unnamed protein product [Plutella xylostella]|uniref:(diamondback moth) hypothetical protein n=1 Tax=Plutella xylostella TaxID=51655 RepID=A0A8S4G340_PLUXY|nr:unnamed protein product [Plutella xylostella]
MYVKLQYEINGKCDKIRKMAYKKITAQENTFVSQMKKRLHRILSTRRGTNTAGFTRLVRGA